MTEYERASLAVPLFVGLLQCGLIAWGISKLDKSDEGRDVLLTALKDQSSVGHWGGLAESIGRHSGAAERAGRGSSAPAGIVPINCSGDTLLHGHGRRESSTSAVAARGRQT